MRLVFAMLCAASLVAGCSASNGESEEDRLMQASRDWSKAAERGDLEAVMGYFADDAVLISEGRAPVRGRQAIRDYITEAYGIPGYRISWEPIEARVSGDLGYLLERTQVSMDRPDGAPSNQTLQAVTIWERQQGGVWKNIVDVTVSGLPDAG